MPHYGKQAWRQFEDRYNSDVSFQAQWNKNNYDVWVRHQEHNGCINKNGKFIALHRELASNNLEVPIGDADVYKRWDAMNMFNKKTSGVSF